MSFQRFRVATSENIVYQGPQEKLSSDNVEDPTNFAKLLYNNDGIIDYLDPGFLDEVLPYPTLGDFPAVGDTSKLYLDQATKNIYRYVDGDYYYVPHDVYSKVEADGKYRLITDSYTKSEADNKYVIRSGTTNDMTGSQINNLTQLSVLNSITANGTNVTISKPVQLGWNDIDFVGTINSKVKLDGTGVQLEDDLNLLTHNVSGVGTLTATTSNLGTLGSNVAGGNYNATGLGNLTATSGTIGTLGSTTLTATTSNLGTLGSNVAGGSRSITGLSSIGATTGTVTTLTATTSNLGTLGSNVAGGSRTITGLGDITSTTGTITTLGSTTGTIATLGSTTGTIGTLNATTSNLGTLGSNVTGNAKTITGLADITSTTGTRATLGSPTGTISTVKTANIQSTTGANICAINSQGFLDFYGTSSTTGGVRFGYGKSGREANEGKIFYNSAGNNLMIIGCNDNGTWSNDNNIRMSDNVTIDNTLTAGATSLGTLACGNTTITGTCSVSGTTTLGTANITTANVSGTATCGNVTCTTNAVIGGNLNTISILNYCVSHSQDITVTASGHQTYTCTVPVGKNYRIVSAMWRHTTTTYELPDFNIDPDCFRRCTNTSAYLYDNLIIGDVIRCTLVMDRNGP
jgi:hypothetical protein